MVAWCHRDLIELLCYIIVLHENKTWILVENRNTIAAILQSVVPAENLDENKRSAPEWDGFEINDNESVKNAI